MDNCLIYTMPLCPYCIKAKKFLQTHHIPYNEKMIVNPAHFKEMKLLTSSLRVPITHYNGKVLTGFKQDEYEETFKEFMQ